MREKIKDFLLNALFTPNGTCPVCGKVLMSREKFFCGVCQASLPQSTFMSCEKCGRPAPDRKRCQNCIKAEETAPDGGCTWLEYSGFVPKIIAEMKFRNRQGLCLYAGRALAETAALQPWIESIDVLVPVPLHPERLKDRGYNQSLLIARGLSQGLERHFNRSFQVMLLLKRVIDTTHQIGKNRKERLTNLDAAFMPEDSAAIQGKNILLIDDVLTTGTTIRACAEVLRACGASKVYTAVCAAVPDLSRA